MSPPVRGPVSLRGVLAWVGVTTVLASSAAALGAAGAFGRPSATSVTRREVTALDCPWQDPAATLPAGARVLAVASAEGGWVGVRNPTNLGQVVWLQSAELRADPGQKGLGSLPGLPCNDQAPPAPPSSEVPTAPPSVPQEVAGATTTVPSTTTTTVPGAPPSAAPSPTSPAAAPTTAAVAPAPSPPTPAPAPRDTTPPVISQSAVSPVEICDTPQTGWSNAASITAQVTDDRGVASVVATFSGAALPALPLAARPNRTYGGTFAPTAATAPANSSVVVTITLTARDAANNTATRTLQTVRVYDAGLCLF